uniref:Brinker DNA-binding domain-containing protein n=1 Tax=Ditylenchus dipsaci TaxID=166011 RepID=A0A915DG31_9BILA
MNDFDSWLYGDDEDHMGWGDQAIVEQIESDDETVALGLISVLKKSQKTKSYTVARKLEIVEYSRKANSIRSAAKKHNITMKIVRDWKLKEPQLRRTRDTVK